MKKKPSFFERLTGSVHVDEDSELEEISENDESLEAKEEWLEDAEGELTVDVHQNEHAIIIKTMVAGVEPSDLEVTVNRDMVTIRGKRENEHETKDEDYFHKELYWGSFSRTIMLPCEVEPEEAVAKEEHGLLTVTIPKIDKHKQMKVKIK